MNQKLLDFNKSQKRTDIPEIQTGDVIEVHKKIIEGEKERIQVFKGLVIAMKGGQSSSPTITIRKDSQGIGTEIVLPIYLPTIAKIEVLRHSKVRRSKIYYMRERTGKSAKMKIKDFSEKEKEVIQDEKNDIIKKKEEAKTKAQKETADRKAATEKK